MEEKQVDPNKAREERLVAWITAHTEKWRDYRDTNFLENWKEFERIFRGQWAAEDKTRDSERSKIISPATQQAVETRHAEIMEAITGSGEFFDIQDDIKDAQKLDIEGIKAQLHEDFKQDKIRKSIDQVVLMAEIYGTGIAEIVVNDSKFYKPATKPIPGTSQAAIGSLELKRTCVKWKPVNPKQFLIDPNADSIEDALGCAIETHMSLHKIVENMEKGIYKKQDVAGFYDSRDIEPTQEKTDFQTGNAVVLKYFGLVPRELLEDSEEETVELFPESSEEADYEDLVEALVVIANGSLLLKAEENPFMMQDRPVVAFQADTVPGRFWGRGTVEKSYNMQKAIDGTLRADMDARALTTAPMMAIDATRLPRGAKFEVKPGKSLLTNGDPREILMPFQFGQASDVNMGAAQQYERLLLQATGTVDSSGLPSQAPRDAGAGGMSMALAGIIKKYKRTLVNFQEDFLIPAINKSVWRYMQFDPDRYPAQDLKFLPTAALGIIAREYEQQQFLAMMSTLGPESPVVPILLEGVLQNSSLSTREAMIEALRKASQPSPEDQMAKLNEQVLLLKEKQATVRKLEADAAYSEARAQSHPVEAQARLVSAIANNLDDDAEGKDFERRIKLADLLLKEKDIDSNERIAIEQMKQNQLPKPKTESE